MKVFWISWHQPGNDYRPLTYPPNESICAWWCSGFRVEGENETPILVAVVKADTEQSAKDAVHTDWPEATDWRFCDEMKELRLSDRFPVQSAWAEQRLQAAGFSQ